ncbi:MAG: SH3 domain-containing protein [Leptospirales bacterium]|nr:SH3 domain-containing protein [Leptospirales bacterium]
MRLLPARQLASYTASLLIALAGCGNQPPDEASNLHADVVNDKASLRIDPVTSSSEIEFLKRGIRVQVLNRTRQKQAIGEANDYWYRIRLEDGVEGWIYGANLSIGDSAGRGADSGIDELLIRGLVGKWWEVRRDGSTGLRRLYLWNTGEYAYAYGQGEQMQRGKYKIDSPELLLLDPPSGVGAEISIRKLGSELRLTGRADDREISFRRAFIDPDAPEPNEEAVGEDGLPVGPGTSTAPAAAPPAASTTP